MKLGADRARQRTETLMFDGTDIVRVVEAAGARHEAAGARPEAELGLAAKEELSGVSEWEGWSMGDWVAGTCVDLEVAGAVAGASGESEGEGLLAGAEGGASGPQGGGAAVEAAAAAEP